MTTRTTPPSDRAPRFGVSFEPWCAVKKRNG